MLPLSRWSRSLTLSLLCLFSTTTLADPPIYGEADIERYDKGEVGIYPEIRYKTTDLVSTHVLRRKWDPACNTGEQFMVAPRGLLVGQPGPMILDQEGYMQWHSAAWPVVYGLTVQKYRGDDYLTFWAGNDQVIGHGSGSYYMVDKNYNVFKRIDPVGRNLTGDLHEFKITKQGTALVTSYLNIPWDLRSTEYNKTGWIWDCYFQEIDIQSGKLLFEWKATDHFTFDDCYNPIRNCGPANNPWDWFHLNSVEKDYRGNYLISSRYSHALSYIDGRSGRVLWNLGGKHNNFKDLSNGKATNFAWQHDARWVEDGKLLSLFDNAAYFGNLSSPSRGLVISIDIPSRSAKLVQEAIHPLLHISESQGSMQTLSGNRMFVGYGSAAAFSEFHPSGRLQCDLQFGALHYHSDGSFSPSAVMSYRTYRHKWVGFPTENPKTAFVDGQFYVSWNGATELAKWMLEGANGIASNERDWKPVAAFDKQGFESSIDIDEGAFKVFRLTAYDAKMRTLGVWIVMSGGDVMRVPLVKNERFRTIFHVLFGAGLALLVSHCYRTWRMGGSVLGGRLPFAFHGNGMRDYLPLSKVAAINGFGHVNGNGRVAYPSLNGYGNGHGRLDVDSPNGYHATTVLDALTGSGHSTPILQSQDAERAARFMQ